MNTLPSLSRPLLFAILLLTALACEDKKLPSETPPPSRSAESARAMPVDAFLVTTSSVQEVIEATGNLIAYEAVEVRPERSGKLVKLDFNESSFVREGTVLAKVDDSELIAQKARLAVNLELAEKEVARGEELLRIQGISQEEVDRLVNRVADLKAEQRILDIQIEKSRIKAPFAGVLGLRQVSQGAYVTPNDVLVELQQINPIKLEFDVPEKFLTKVREGQNLKFTIVGSEEEFAAKVYAIGTEIASTTRTFKIRATSANPRNVLKPGMFAKVTLITGVNDQAILVPTDAIIPVLDGKQVYVARKGRAIATPVVTSERQAKMVQVVEGLSMGDTVITSGLLSLSDGAPVIVTSVESPSKNDLQ